MGASGISRGHKFVNDLVLYAIGNIGSKLITFMLVPFYTFFITDPAEFGYYDICLTVAFGMIPLITLQLHEGGFRFLMEAGELQRKQAIVSFILRTVFLNSAIILIIGSVLGQYVEIKYLGYMIMFGIAQAFIDSWLQIVRGVGLIKVYVAAGIFNSLLIALLSVFAVAVLEWGVPGIFVANISARFLTLVYLEFKAGIVRKYFSIDCRTCKVVSREIVKYSLPLLPLSVLWWILNNNGVFFIKEFLGLEENGIYAILAKFTGILYVLVFIFYQTWQQNAIEQYNSPERNRFFSAVFNNYFYLLCFFVAVFPFALRINYSWLVSPEYYSSSQYLFANSVFMMCFALCSFFEIGYQCSKNTSGILPGVLIAMTVNIAGNFYCVPLFGIFGLIAVNILTYVVLLVYRVVDTRKYMRVSFSPRNIVGLCVLSVAGILFAVQESSVVDVIFIIVTAIVFYLCIPKNNRDAFFEGFMLKRKR